MVVLSELSQRSSSTRDHFQYDVFLSFRGADTRNSFTDHLYNALKDANLETFLDDDEIETGLIMKPKLEEAIKSSRASVIILSMNYASSTWCLEELVLILEQHAKFNQVVIPVFYHVEPTDVRKQQNTFGEAMAKHKERMEVETNVERRSQLALKMKLWSSGLTQVANMKGKDARGRKETEFIEEIVSDIHHRLGVPLRTSLPLLIGVGDNIKFITSWLKDRSSYTADILTILGIGGIGKTSLAKYVYGLHCYEFDRSSFIEDIIRRCALLDVQKQLCDEISRKSSNPIHDVYVYTSKIENALARKRVFLVLDDIDSVDQLDALLGKTGFHPGSKIIITTKDASLVERFALYNPHVHQVYLNGLYGNKALELLSIHAFKSQNPKEGYEDVSNNLVKYCEGHPLALEVLGKSLCNCDVANWEARIEGLRKEPESRIQKALQMSYDALASNNDKELFKHIACFFVGVDRDVTETILEACEINTKVGIKNLTDRCLLSIGWENDLRMHKLVQDMARDVVHQESPDKPWKRSRLWCHEESFKVLKQNNNKGKENLKGISLDVRMLDKKKLRGSLELNIDSLSQMDDLLLLQLNYVQINAFFEIIPEELRWLCMHGFPLKSIPSDLPTKNLVALDMSYSKIESFGMCYCNPRPVAERQKHLIGPCSKYKQSLGSLKILNLSFCEQLHSLCGFRQLYALERLIVRRCLSLHEVCESIEQCVELVFVDLSYCYKLKKLPTALGKLKKVSTLLLDGCNFCESKFEMWDTDSSNMFVADIGINSQTSSAVIIEAIPRDLSLGISLPCSLVCLSLTYNKLSNESFPNDLSSLSMLKELHLDGNHIYSMPNCVRNLPRLEILSMYDCMSLMSIELPPCTLRELSFGPFNDDGYPSLEKIVFHPKMSPLIYFGDYMGELRCSSFQVDGLMKVEPMEHVAEKVLHSLGWTNLEFLKNMCMATDTLLDGWRKSQTQMYYEFGIFSTFYGGEYMPNWINNRREGPSISFTIPSSPNLLCGLDFCCVETLQFSHYMASHKLPMIKISNITKGHTWIYDHYNDSRVFEGGKCLTYLSHWMFGMDEMESGDHVTIIVIHQPLASNVQVTRECGVRLMYDDGMMGEEDALGYYKSCNHINDGDLSTFQTTLGDYILGFYQFMRYGHDIGFEYSHGIHDGAGFKDEKQVQRKSDILDRTSSQMEEKEEDALSYYKSWNHIIGGDLSAFQTTSGEYILNVYRFTRFSDYIESNYLGLVADDARYKEKQVLFKAFSQRKS